MTRLAIVGLLSLALPGAAAAGDLFGGYSFERTGGDDAVSRHGWNASVAVPVTGAISLVGDAGGHYGSSQGLDSRQLTLMGGPRFYYVRGSRYSLFAQFLAGLLRETASVKVLDVTISESENRFGILSGAGLDVRAGDRWSVRLSGDYEWSTKDGVSRGGFRAGVGGAYRF